MFTMISIPQIFTPRSPDALVISGGGVKGIAALGAVHAIAPRLKDVKLVAGTSSGAIVAAAVALERKPLELLKAMVEGPYVPRLSLENIANGFGLDSGAHISQWIDMVLETPTTFGDILERTGIELIVCATNLTTRQPVYFGPRTHPSMDVGTAIRMSCAVPLFFTAVRYEGDVFVDGGICDNFPLEMISRRAKRPVGIIYKDTSQGKAIDTLDQYLNSLISCIVRYQKVEYGTNVLEIDCGNLGSAPLFTRPKKMKSLFKSGYKQAKEWVKKND